MALEQGRAVSEQTGFQHQCRTPPVWWSRLIGSRAGREWVCPNCRETWVLGYTPLIHEWKLSRRDVAERLEFVLGRVREAATEGNETKED